MAKKTSQQFLENLVEVSHLIMGRPEFAGQNSVWVRNIAIKAAQVFHRVETRLLKCANDSVNYEWMDATEAFAEKVAKNSNATSREIAAFARAAILGNGVVL